MKRIFMLAIVVALLFPATKPLWAHNPFTSKPETQHKAPEPPFKSQFFVKIILWQHQLKQRMSELIRAFQNGGNIKPLIILMGIAFLYGIIHAAGPGHGKFVAMSYALSHKASIIGGILFGFFIAAIHGLSGAVGVLGLHYVIQRGISETLASVTDVTQLVSFGLIVLLGLGIVIKNSHQFFYRKRPKHESMQLKSSRLGLLPWALAVGVVPCPAVVMVMLFCISMGVLVLGFILAACISFGMAATISFVVTSFIVGKAGILNAVPERSVQMIEGSLGILSGTAIMIFGTLFLLTTINTAFY